MVQLYRRDQAQLAIREGQEATRKAWAPFHSLKKFLYDYYPRELERISRCSMSFELVESPQRPGYVRRRPRRCTRVPLCILCVKSSHWRRIRQTQDQLAQVTPKGHTPRLYHIVIDSSLKPDGSGWGVKASRDLEAFGRVVWRSLEDIFGEGLGAAMSYQDFGEKGFAKQFPHMDLTMNGYAILDGQAKPIPRVDLTGRGVERVKNTVLGHAATIDVAADWTDVNFQGPWESFRSYYDVLKYQTRELVDLRKLEYDRGNNLVWWWSYKDNTRTPLPVREFVNRLDEYQERLGQWIGEEGRKQLHRTYGHMAKRTIAKTARMVGGEPIPHGDDCLWSCCGDWFNVRLDDEEVALNRGARIVVEAG